MDDLLCVWGLFITKDGFDSRCMLKCIRGTMDCFAKINKESDKILELQSTLLQYRCFISGKIMQNPVVASDGVTYDEEVIKKWILKKGYSPMTGKNISANDLIADKVAFDTIVWCLKSLTGFTGSDAKHLSWISRSPTTQELLTYRYEVTIIWNCVLEKQISKKTFKKIQERVKNVTLSPHCMNFTEWFPSMYEPHHVSSITWDNSHAMRFFTYKEFVQVFRSDLVFDRLPDAQESLKVIAMKYFVESMTRNFAMPKSIQIERALHGYARIHLSHDDLQFYFRNKSHIDKERQERWTCLFDHPKKRIISAHSCP